MGYAPAKTRWIKRESRDVSFSFILKRRGLMRYGDQSFSIESPCVFVQWPGVYEEYGPEPEGASWEEVFITYDPSLTRLFETWDPPPAKQPVWPITWTGDSALRKQPRSTAWPR